MLRLFGIKSSPAVRLLIGVVILVIGIATERRIPIIAGVAVIGYGLIGLLTGRSGGGGAASR